MYTFPQEQKAEFNFYTENIGKAKKKLNTTEKYEIINHI